MDDSIGLWVPECPSGNLAEVGGEMRHVTISPKLLIGGSSVLLLLLLGTACGSGSGPIVFTSDRDGNRELYSVRNGDGETNITNTAQDEYSPAVSPDGQWVAFLAVEGADVVLEAMWVDGTERQRLTPGPGRRSMPRWDTDSSRIAYVQEMDGVSNIYVVGIDGSEPMRLSSIPSVEVGNWSHDGQSVVFAARVGEERGIYVRNPDGVNEFRLTDAADTSPIWSPDSEMIAFLSRRGGGVDLFVMNADGSEQRQLTDNDASEYQISWSPSGRQVLFVSEVDGNPEVYAVDLEHKLVRLTTNKIRDDEPVWSPDGRQIAFVSYGDSDPEIFVMDADGGSQDRLTNNSYRDSTPSW